VSGDSGAVVWSARGVLQIVRDVVTEVAPEELPFLAALEQLPPDEIGRALARGDRRDDPLGFGMSEIAAIATPILWAALQQVVDQMASAAADGTAARVRTLLRKRFGSRKRTADRAFRPWPPRKADRTRPLPARRTVSSQAPWVRLPRSVSCSWSCC
jgi:hypothetical protein